MPIPLPYSAGEDATIAAASGSSVSRRMAVWILASLNATRCPRASMTLCARSQGASTPLKIGRAHV